MDTMLRMSSVSAAPLLRQPKTKTNSFNALSSSSSSTSFSSSFFSNIDFGILNKTICATKSAAITAVSFPRRGLSSTRSFSYSSERNFFPKVMNTAASSEKGKKKFRRSKRLPSLQPADRIDYRNITLLSRFISEQGKILSRRVNRLSLKQQRMITRAIKQARILSLLPFVNNERQYESDDLSPTTTASFRSRSR